MSDHADNPYAAPRDPADADAVEWGISPSPREYRYRKLVGWMQYVIPTIVGIPVVAIGASLPLLIAKLPLAAAPGTYAGAGVMLALLLAFAVTSWWVYHRFAGITVVLEDNGLVFRYYGAEKRLPLDERMRVMCFGSWLQIRSGDDTIRLTESLEGSGHLVRSLKAALDIRSLNDGYDESRLFRFFQLAESSDERWRRFETIWWRLVVLAAAGAVLGGLVARVRGIEGFEVVICIVLSAFWPTIVYYGTEVVFDRSFARRVDRANFTCAPPDTAWERRIYRRATAVGLAVYGAAIAALWLI